MLAALFDMLELVRAHIAGSSLADDLRCALAHLDQITDEQCRSTAAGSSARPKDPFARHVRNAFRKKQG
ncbi:hypothetical protein [Sphingomonas sp. UNC305MFCol5.2]|uniref:hypothetical protein n=1 Tax=Sphingomonas sp. UNC305MFCol5.2 TaxID=1449076 RepID=UPI00042225A8|nr:hypothetical protein [Sphingomonas sp. UNC305MFCol5.2]